MIMSATPITKTDFLEIGPTVSAPIMRYDFWAVNTVPVDHFTGYQVCIIVAPRTLVQGLSRDLLCMANVLDRQAKGHCFSNVT